MVGWRKLVFWAAVVFSLVIPLFNVESQTNLAKIAVLPLQGRGVSASEAQDMTGLFEKALVGTKQFVLLGSSSCARRSRSRVSR